jgi:cytochrome c peroxidase
MHDGRFQSLEEVLAHYAEGILAQPHLNGALPKNTITLSQEEQSALLAFLATLNDHAFAQGRQSK